MVRPPRSSLPEEDLEEEEEHYYGEDFTPLHDSSTHRESGESGKLDGKKGSMNSHRWKHSETEQQRRSKINERFQALRDLIPQNDQKRDKASLLLEVIEYIHFLQQRLQMYEGPCEGYHHEPTKLAPWRNSCGAGDSHVEPAQVMRNGTSHENNVAMNPGMPTAAKDSLQPEIENGAVPLQMPSDMLATFGRGDLSGTVQLPLPNNVGDLGSHPQPQWWLHVPFAADYTVPNNLQNQHEELDMENRSENISSAAYSQGILIFSIFEHGF